MSVRFNQGSVGHRSGSRSGQKGKVILPNNESLHSRHVTLVLGIFLGVEIDGDTHFTIRATVWPKMMKINPRRHWLFRVLPRHRGGGVIRPPRVWPLIELELRGKNDRVGLPERKPMVPNINVSGQLMTPEVRSNTRAGRLR